MESTKKTYDARKLTLEKALTEAEQLLKEDPVRKSALQKELPRINRALNRFLETSDKLIEAMLKAKDEEHDITDMDEAQSVLFGHAESVMKDIEDLERGQFPEVREDDDTSSTAAKSHHHRLPKLELPKFGGEARDWLQFWSAFQSVHADDSISATVKFQYLNNCMIPGSSAQEIVISYPISAENYPEAIKSLEERFGRKDMLVDVYIRDLIGMILENATSKAQSTFSSLYVRLSSQLRALGSLGVTTDKCAAILYPMVESSLPDDVLVAWGRIRQQAVMDKDKSEKQLEKLMEFLKSEVEGSERIRLARQPFSSNNQVKGEKSIRKSAVPTAATLIATEPKSKQVCLFCDKSHPSESCCKAMSMPFEERRKMVQEKRRCFCCLKQGHSAKKCREVVKCLLCGRKHWAIVCPESTKNQPEKEKKDQDLQLKEPNKNLDMCNQVTLREVPLQTVVVKLQVDNKTKIVRAMLDGGSQRSYVLKKTAIELNLPKQGKHETTHLLFGGHEEKLQHYNYDVQMSSLDSNFSQKFRVDDHPVICNSIPKVTPGKWMMDLKEKGIVISDRHHQHLSEIEVLLGNDVYGRLLTGKKIDLECGISAIETVFGWTLSGPIPTNGNQPSRTYHIRDANIQDLWNLDIIGIEEPTKEKSKEELANAALEFFKQTVKRKDDGRYIIKLPWIEGHPRIPSYRIIAEKKLENNTARLRKQGVLESYHGVFSSWEKEGIIERMENSKGHYLSHHGVIKSESATTPVRPVFNASFKTKGNPSLNGCLEIGPNMLEEIPAILTRFRLGTVGVTSDIKKAFCQIEVDEADRDHLRFLWYTDETCKQVQEFRHSRVVFGVNSSPFLLQAVLDYHLSRSPVKLQPTAAVLKKSYYVDNCCVSLSNHEEALRFKDEATKLMSTAMMELRGWEIGPFNKDKNVPILGITWNLKDDYLFVELKGILSKMNDKPITKRKILSIAQSLFDPTGSICAFTVVPKMILQDTFRLKAGWDSKLPEEITEKFLNWSKQIPELLKVRIPRCLAVNQDKSLWSLHIFTDASSLAYSACAYLRSGIPSKIEVQLIMARSRVAPIKEATIPRLELIGCVCGARLSKKVKEMMELPELPVTFWTDSTTALAWIKNDKSWSVFVSHRVQEIRKLTPVENWRHVPGKVNPADVPSRGATVKALLESKWWQGPNWLKNEEHGWPSVPTMEDEVEVQAELKKTIICHLNLERKNILKKLNEFSDFHKIIRIVVYLRRFVKWINVRFGAEKNKTKIKNTVITFQEMKEAEEKIVKLVQEVSFSGTNDMKLKNLQTFEDKHGIIRVKTRLFPGEGGELSCPVVLPSKEETVLKLIWKTHQLHCHAGVQMLQVILREKYWILCSRRTIRGVIYTCAKCRRFRSQPVQAPEGPLPKDRFTMGAAFNVTGVDMAGPLFTKGKKKVWIAIFTCATYRAIHLELCNSLTTEVFIGALRRFVARRGRPSVIYSDNGLNFVGCRNLLKNLDWKKVTSYACVTEISWKFNPPTASWWGGFWERMIGIVKQLLRAVLGSSRVNNEELQTLLCDVEGTVNNRPLTYVSEDGNELMPLTPNALIRNCGSSHLPDVDLVEREQLVTHFKNIQHCREEMRSRFKKEYLAMLVSHGKSKKFREVKVGEVVLVGNDQKKRIDWPMGIIEEVIPGRDGHVRYVRVKTANGKLTRPIQRLFPLEVKSNE